MKRRQFLKSSLIASLIAAVSFKALASPPQLWDHVAEALANRRNGKPPNFVEIHRCYDCQHDFYCPDRWMAQRCEVKAYCEDRGWRTDAGTCLPCKFGTDMDATVAANMAAWREAHYV